MNYKKIVETAVLTGEIMLKSGAEIYRVEDTIGRILSLSQLKSTRAFVTSTGIIVTLTDKEKNVLTMAGRVSERDTNLQHIYMANNISRNLCSGIITIDEAYEQLSMMETKQEYSPIMINICIVLTTIFFTVRTGGTFLECFLSGWNGVIIVLGYEISQRIGLNKLVTILFSAFLMAFLTVILRVYFQANLNLEVVISSSIMPLLPGVAMTNAVRDTLQGDSVSGGARIIEAFVLAAIIAAGIGGGFLVCTAIFGGELI